MIQAGYRIQILDGNDTRYELIMPSDTRSDGRPKYYRSQHLVHCRQSKQRAHLGKAKSNRMTAKLVARADRNFQSKSDRQSRRRDRRRKPADTIYRAR